ncbi:MAG: crossover junction endodeoxyribonuclease RuvC [Candidatus Omnitrophica bacterium]|nr:crossover junction endodeoxyribonuclease RuvC [Candidatus Omnitrophota bacterium]
MMIILGIDPGLNATGYGVIEAQGGRWQVVTAGDLRPPRRRPLAERLAFIHDGLEALMSRCHPQTAVLEMVFTHQAYRATAALMAHARGVACLAVQEQGLAMAEYPPARIKQALTGHGAASKAQVARMVGQWLGRLDPAWSSDATDALALALAHARMDAQRRRLPAGAVK